MLMNMIMLRINDPERPLTLSKFILVPYMICLLAKMLCTVIILSFNLIFMKTLSCIFDDDQVPNKLLIQITSIYVDMFYEYTDTMICIGLIMLIETCNINEYIRFLIIVKCELHMYEKNWLKWLWKFIHVVINTLINDHDKLETMNFIKDMKMKPLPSKRCNMLLCSMCPKIEKKFLFLKIFSVISKEYVRCKILTDKITWFDVNSPKSRATYCACAKVTSAKIKDELQKFQEKCVFWLRLSYNLSKNATINTLWIHGITGDKIFHGKKLFFKVKSIAINVSFCKSDHIMIMINCDSTVTTLYMYKWLTQIYFH